MSTGHVVERWRKPLKSPAFTLSSKLSTMRELDELIRAGWGDTPQEKIPADWREKPRRRSHDAPLPECEATGA